MTNHRRWLRIVAGLLVGLGVVYLFITNGSTDSGPTNRADIAARITTIDENQNAYQPIAYLDSDTYAVFKDEAQRETIRDHWRGERWDAPFVQQMLTEHQQLLTDTERAIRREHFRTKTPAWNTHKALPRYANFLDTAHLFVLQAATHLRAQQPKAAAQSLKTAITLGHLIGSDTSSALIGYQFGLAVMYAPLEFIQIQMRDDATDATTLHALLEALQTVPPYQADGFATAFIGEQLLTIETGVGFPSANDSVWKRIKTLAKSIGPNLATFTNDAQGLDTLKYTTLGMAYTAFPAFYVHPNQAVQLKVQSYETAASQSGKFCDQVDFGEPLLNWSDVFVPNSVGLFLAAPNSVNENLRRYFEGRCMFHSYVSAVKLALQIKAATGTRQTASGASRAPATDYFTGGAIQHNNAQQFLAWSGGNYQYDGGATQASVIGRCKPAQACFSNPTVPLRHAPQVTPLAAPQLRLPKG